MRHAVTEYGRLDMAFNNAGIQVPPSDAADETADSCDRVNAVNLRGVWAAMKHELQQMRKQGSGAIVNRSSLGGLVGLPERAAYHASKHGVIGLTRSAAVEYASKGVRINAICPGVIDTPMVADMVESQANARAAILTAQPIGRLGTAEEIAAAVLWLCRPGASFVVGTAIPVDGQLTAPRSLSPGRGPGRPSGRPSGGWSGALIESSCLGVVVSLLLSVTFACGVVIAVAHVLNRPFIAPIYDVVANLTAFFCAAAASLLLGHLIPASLSAIAILCWLVLARRTALARRSVRRQLRARTAGRECVSA